MEVYQILQVSMNKETGEYTVHSFDSKTVTTDPTELAQLLTAAAIGILKADDLVRPAVVKNLAKYFKEMGLLNEQTS